MFLLDGGQNRFQIKQLKPEPSAHYGEWISHLLRHGLQLGSHVSILHLVEDHVVVVVVDACPRLVPHLRLLVAIAIIVNERLLVGDQHLIHLLGVPEVLVKLLLELVDHFLEANEELFHLLGLLGEVDNLHVLGSDLTVTNRSHETVVGLDADQVALWGETGH